MAPDSALPEIPERVRCIQYRMHDRTLCTPAPEDLVPAVSEDRCFVWVDIQAPTVQPLNALLQTLGTELSVGKHFDYPAILPRVFEHPDCLVCYLYEVSDPDRHLNISSGLGLMESNRMIMVLGERFILTYHRNMLPCIQYVESRSAAVFKDEGRGSAFIAYLLFQRCMYEYAHLNLANDNYLDQLQSGLQSDNDDFDDLAGIIDLANANILTLKKMISSLQIVLGRLTTMQAAFIDEDFRARILQLHQNAFPVRWALDSSRQFIDGIVGGMNTATANRMSEIATVLTIVSTIILPLTLISGIYGMNFDDIWEIHVPYGYYICLSIMAAVVAAEIWMFQRLGWLRSVTRALKRLVQEPKKPPARTLEAELTGDASHTGRQAEQLERYCVPLDKLPGKNLPV
jgi:magnesium transporter